MSIGSAFRITAVACFLGLQAVYLASALARDEPTQLEGRVVGVADGDTVTVLDQANKQHRIRLAGIDAPEKGQAFGQASRKHLSELVFRRQVIVEARKTDRYGRVVGRVLVGGKDVGLEQLRAGLAWHYKQYEREQPPGEARAYAAAENAARVSRTGLWADREPVAPWDFRRTNRAGKRPQTR